MFSWIVIFKMHDLYKSYGALCWTCRIMASGEAKQGGSATNMLVRFVTLTCLCKSYWTLVHLEVLSWYLQEIKCLADVWNVNLNLDFCCSMVNEFAEVGQKWGKTVVYIYFWNLLNFLWWCTVILLNCICYIYTQTWKNQQWLQISLCYFLVGLNVWLLTDPV